MPSQQQPQSLTVRVKRPTEPLRNQPRYVEIYSARNGVWTWSVAFEDLGYSRTGTAGSYDDAVEWVRGSVAAGQLPAAPT